MERKAIKRTAVKRRPHVQRLDRIEHKLDLILGRLIKMAHTGKEVLAAVQAERTVIDSLGVFVQQLKDQLVAQGIDQQAIDAAFEGITGNTLTEAAFMNTPTPAPAGVGNKKG